MELKFLSKIKTEFTAVAKKYVGNPIKNLLSHNTKVKVAEKYNPPMDIVEKNNPFKELNLNNPKHQQLFAEMMSKLEAEHPNLHQRIHPFTDSMFKLPGDVVIRPFNKQQ